jgi:pyruvate,orthophosphate dikinase
MSDNIFFFNSKEHDTAPNLSERIGVRGAQALELAGLNLPIAPGFIIDSELTRKIDNLDSPELKRDIIENMKRMEVDAGKKFNDPENPLLVKVVVSPNIKIRTYPSIHNVGLTDQTVQGFAKLVGDERFAYNEYKTLLEDFGLKLFGMREDEFRQISGGLMGVKLFEGENKKVKMDAVKEIVRKYKMLVGDKFPQDGYEQVSVILRMFLEKYMEEGRAAEDIGIAFLVQAMVYGNYGEDSSYGTIFSRDIVTGEKKLTGYFGRNRFFVDASEGEDISEIEKKHLEELTKMGNAVEEHFREIRHVNFTVERGKLWLIDQRPVDNKSIRAEINTLLDLNRKGIVDKKYVVNEVKPGRLGEILHNIIDPASTKGLPRITGGIGGSTGSAVGRVYFSANDLIMAHKQFSQRSEDSNVILVMGATFAEDVKGIEIGQGVLTSEGGYASHAPVVARSIGKTAMVNPKLKIDEEKKRFTIDGKVVKEGDYITLEVPSYKEPTIYLGKARLVAPDPKESGLIDFLNMVDEFIGDFNVRANGDSERDATVAKQFGARGIGLCRTEHMFFEEKRIDTFREMILASTEEERRKALNKLLPFQRDDFYRMFKVMQGLPVTIRLLDAPLHEFLPHTKDSMDHMIKYFGKLDNPLPPEEVRARCDNLREFNPMLGHRGCRVAVSYPEIYEMQTRAIFEAACQLKVKDKIEVEPEIMIPIVMSPLELKFLKNGKEIEGRRIKGVKDIEKEVLEEYGVDKMKYKVGTMVELPAAAILSDRLAQYAEFFSYGTNDLTQTTNGLSRDDINSFFPDYTKYDLLENNPFKVLVDSVKELISISAQRGRLTRPDLKLGLCGEHGADPNNIEFCYRAGLNYVSCSAYSVPVAKLAIAQLNIKEQAEEKA